ncbi:MAG: helicase HerA domain-containing protein [Gemmataceae bacterium]
MPKDIDRPSCFYLGREYDLSAQKVVDRPVLYDAADLTTHGVVVGMTGSGKTGLCINLLEEAAIDGIPCILIDPKGDLTNLLLQFPELDPQDFLKWLNPEDARQRGVSLEEYAKQLAEQWRKGLEEWGQKPERIKRLKEAGDFRIYTPGSEAGLPLSILQTFTAPKGAVTREALNQKIDATTTALLGLTGISADPVKSREHILIAQLLLNAWTKGQDLDLTRLINEIQEPPITTVGAFDIDTFYPQKDRLKLAVALNNILAAPSFSTWITGEGLDLAKLLGDGPKPRHLIFYIAHLDDAQRMFFITLLLEEILSWTRKQSGTTNLRAIVYFDEVFGYLPPHPANPPTKGPLMTLLKQARAFGVGILLATQNPVDVDYKALSNAGTWFIGKLQTERDKARLIEGLQGVAAERGTLSDRAYLETVISALANRVFLLHDVHCGQPILLKSRQALSFLRGPLTRDQIELLMQPIKEKLLAGEKQATKAGSVDDAAPAAIPLCPKCRAELHANTTACVACGTPWTATLPRQEDQPFKKNLLKNAVVPGRSSGVQPTEASTNAPPELPPGIAQFYLSPGKQTANAGKGVAYRAGLLACAEIAFCDKKRNLDVNRPFRLLTLAGPGVSFSTWQNARPVSEELASGPEPGACWEAIPEPLNSSKKLKLLEKEFLDYLYGNAKLVLYENRKLQLISAPGEDAQVFLERCRQTARQQAAKALEAEKKKFEPKFTALGAVVPQAGPPAQEPVRNGGSWLDWLPFLGSTTIQVSSSRNLTAKQRTKLLDLEKTWQTKKEELAAKWKEAGEEYSEVTLKPRKVDIRITQFGIAWAPIS